MSATDAARQAAQLERMIAELDQELTGLRSKADANPTPSSVASMSTSDMSPAPSSVVGTLLASNTVAPPDGPVPRLTQEYLAKLQIAFDLRWHQLHADVSIGGNTDTGYFGPLAEVVAGQAPSFVVDQIVQDLTNWNLPARRVAAKAIATTITRNISLNGGSQGFQNGVVQKVDLLWQVGYGAMNITESELGVLYVFGAAVGA